MQLSIQKVPKISGFDPVTKEPKIRLTRLKELTFSNGEDIYPLMAGDGVALAHFKDGKSFTVSGSSATLDQTLMAIQLGTDVEVLVDSTEIRVSEILTVEVVDTATLTWTATGTAGEEVKWAEIIDTSGDAITKLEQAATIAPGKFTVTGTALAFDAGEAPLGTRIRVYYYPTASSARKIQNLTSQFSLSLEWDIECRFLDICSKKEVLGYLALPYAMISGAFDWAVTGGDPAVQAFELTAEIGCLEEELYKLITYSEDDLT